MCRAARYIAQRGPGQGATLQDTYKEAFPGDNRYDAPKAKAALARLPILCVKNRVKGDNKSVYDEHVVYERLENGFPDAYAHMAKVHRSFAEKVLADEKNQTFALTPDVDILGGCKSSFPQQQHFVLHERSVSSSHRMYETASCAADMSRAIRHQTVGTLGSSDGH